MIRRHTASAAMKLAAVAASLFVTAFDAHATIIDFDSEGLTGPSFASETAAGPIAVTTPEGTVNFANGAILTNESALPADETSVYYNSFFLPGSAGQTMTITFANSIQNFFMNVYNGQVADATFTVSDNTGLSTTVTIAPNSASGVSLISFPAAGNVITIFDSDPSWDYSIDNIGFDQATPSVPEPSEWALMALALAAAVGASAWRRPSVAMTGAAA